MPIDSRVPRSPGWWLERLGADLASKRTRLDLLASYACGNHPLPEAANSSTREAYKKFQAKARTNYPALISGAVRELLLPTGFRTSVANDERGDEAANRIWQANSLDADSGLVHGTALDMSEAYVIVGPVDPSTGEPVITAEDPRQVIAATDPLRPRRTVAAAKFYVDAYDGVDVAYLYVPGEDGRIEVHKAARSSTGLPINASSWSAYGFEWVGDVETLNVTRNPVIRFRNRPQIDGTCIGEFEDVLDMVDRINHQTLDRLVIAMMQAFRQRALKGSLPTHDREGNLIDWGSIFAPGPDALWRLPDGIDLWESAQVDLRPIIEANAADVSNLGAVTRTPPFYLNGDLTNASAEAAALARMGLENKAQDRQREFGESWEETLAVAFEFKGDEARSRALDLEIIWKPVQRYSLNEKANAIAQMKDTVPWRTLMQDVYQASPLQLDRMEAERADEQLLTPALSEPVNPVAATQPGEAAPNAFTQP